MLNVYNCQQWAENFGSENEEASMQTYTALNLLELGGIHVVFSHKADTVSKHTLTTQPETINICIAC